MLSNVSSYNPYAFGGAALQLLGNAPASNRNGDAQAGTSVARATSTAPGGLTPGLGASLAEIDFIITGQGAKVTTASAETGATGSSAEVAESNTSSLTFRVDPSVQDLANEYAAATQNDAGVVRPNVGPSPWVDALAGLAKGSDVALAAAAREALQNVTQAQWNSGGQEIAYKDIGPDVAPDNLAHAAEYIASPNFAESAIVSIASSIAQGQQPDAFLVNLLHARMNGSITVVDTTALSKTENLAKYNTAYNSDIGYGDSNGDTFNFEAIAQPNSTSPLSSFSASTVAAAYREN
jgi:hypothetical protein